MRTISPLAAYIFAAAVAAMLVVVGMFVWSATNSEAEPIRTAAEVRNAEGTFLGFFLLFWLLGLVWSSPFLHVAKREIQMKRSAPAMVWTIAGALSGLTGVSVALWIGSWIAGDTPMRTWMFFCPLMTASGGVGGLAYFRFAAPTTS